ncbi:MAG: methyltransferase family protein [Longimicrobiales bacterium]|jgi:protein-S-isoprenylcysteine O-methyltransferase Ste14
MDKARYVVGVLVVVAVAPGMVWWFSLHPFVNFWRKVGAGATLSIMMGLAIVQVLVLLNFRDTLLMTDYGTQPGLPLLAILLGTASFSIALARRRHLSMRILVGLPELASDGSTGELLNEGIYARIRHPRYVEILLGVAAYAAFANYLGAYIVMIALIPVLHLIVLLEERELIDRFGEVYNDYATQVPRYLPRRGA